MSTVEVEKPKSEAKKPIEERSVSYVPLGHSDKVELKFDFVRKYLCHPTKSGLLPSESDIVKFLKLCERQALDPWVGDAFLTGYDTWDDSSGKFVANFSLITAVQALLKRAELSHQFDGMESGVIVMKDGEPFDRKGTIVLDNETLVGGWAKVFRKDHSVPHYATVQFKTYDTGRSRWRKDPAGMIVKCSRASALREGFPTHLAGLYTEEEMDRVVEGEVVKIAGESNQSAITSKANGSLNESEVQMVRGPQDLVSALKQRNAKIATPSKTMKEPEEPSQPDGSAILREELLAELEAADTEIGVESIEADINTVPELNEVDRKILLRALGAKLAMQS